MTAALLLGPCQVLWAYVLNQKSYLPLKYCFYVISAQDCPLARMASHVRSLKFLVRVCAVWAIWRAAPLLGSCQTLWRYVLNQKSYFITKYSFRAISEVQANVSIFNKNRTRKIIIMLEIVEITLVYLLTSCKTINEGLHLLNLFLFNLPLDCHNVQAG